MSMVFFDRDENSAADRQDEAAFANAAAGSDRALSAGAAPARKWAAAFGVPLAMLVYAIAVAILCRALGHPENFNSSLYTGPIYTVYCLFSLIVFLILMLRHFLDRSGQSLLWFRRTWLPKEFLMQLAWAIPLLVMMPFFMTAFTGAKNLLNDLLPFAWDNAFEALSKRVDFGYHAYELLPISDPLATRALETVYAFWGVLLVAVPFAVSLRRIDCPLRMRFLVSFALILVLLGNVSAGAFMSAGPFWLESNAPGQSGFAPLFAYLQHADPDGQFSAVRFQQYLMAANHQGLTYVGTGISAFPSIHVAMATLFVLAAWPFGTVARGLSLAFLAAIFVGSVGLGWHYSVDGYASIILTCAIYGSVGWVQRRPARRARETA